jgi:uncharacterized protein YgiM (DUF1202 family)
VLLFCAVTLPFGPLAAQATASFDSTTGGVPFATSFIYPVGVGTVQPTWDHGNANGYFISQAFNTSCDPSAGQGYYMYGLYYCGHTGIDLATGTADPAVHATAAGLVVTAGYNGSYGVMVRIRHFLPDGSVMYSQYEHMAFGSLAVYGGEVITQGQQLGLVGATGFATGAHLHFEIKGVDEDGWGYTFGNASLIAGYLDPLPFVAAHQLQPASFISSTAQPVQTFPTESDPLLRQFLKSFRHYVVVAVDNGLNVRSGPGLRYRPLGTALRGAKLGYVHTQGTWIKVSLPQHVTGWVDRRYVAGWQDWDKQGPTARGATWPPVGAQIGLVRVLGLNVRSGPGQEHSITTSVFQGDKVQVLSRTTHWARIKTRDGATGWVLRLYLDGAAAGSGIFVVPTVPLLHVRSGPGLQYDVSGSVYSGTKMQILRTTPNWASVLLPGGSSGWVARPLTTSPGQVAAGARTAVRTTALATTNKALVVHARFVRVSVGILNLRSGPGQNHEVVACVKQDTTLQVLALTSHWAHVALPASVIDGWVLRSLTS